MNVFNEEYEQNELITNDIKVTSSLFKKIYKFTEFNYGNVSKSFIYITIEVELYENENENKNEYNDDNGNDDNGDNNSIYTNVSMDNTHSTYFQDEEDLDSVNINADACSVNTTDSHFRASSKNRKNKKNMNNKTKRH